MKMPLADYCCNTALLQPENQISFISEEQRLRLLQNGRNNEQDPYPVVWLHMPGGGVQWLLSAIDPGNPSIAFGLCDLGFGVPELETVSFAEMALISTELVRPIECDQSFKALYPMSVYARAARLAGKSPLTAGCSASRFLVTTSSEALLKVRSPEYCPSKK